MIVFLTEKSLTGLSSALFYSFTERVTPDGIFERDSIMQNLTDRYTVIENDNVKARRVNAALIKYAGAEIISYLKICLLSCDDNALTAAFNYAHFTLLKKSNVAEMLSDKRVSDFYYLIKKVLNEKHRFTGFIRFKETASGVLYAPYSPDNDITELLCPHFVNRLSAVPFVIHDVKRNIAGVSDGKRFKIMKTETQAVLNLSENEREWENLWKDYYNAVNIKERRNKKQQNNLMPLRYRKFLPETYE